MNKSLGFWGGMVFAFLFLTGCKVNYSLKGITIPPEAKSIAIPLFENNASMANPVEAQKFTEALRDMVGTQTNLALVKNNSDLQFEGYIAEYKVFPVAIGTDQAQVNRLEIHVLVKYKNRFDTGKDFEETFKRFADFSSSASLSSVEAGLMAEINKMLCEDIFNRAFNNW